MTQARIISLPDGGQLNVQISGPDGAPWLVLSNSVMTDLRIWDGQIASLAERFRVLRYDQRGHGRSSVTDGPLDFKRYGADLLAILDACDVARCSFVGLSMGTPTGLAAYAAAPDRFDGFVAVDGIARSAPGREAFWSERRTLARSAGMAALASGTAERWLPGLPAESKAVATLTAMIAATPVEGFSAATHALQSYDYTDAAEGITCPFLGIAGALDGTMPDAIAVQFGDIPDAQFSIIPQAGHLPNYQCPDAFNTALLRFLDTNAPATSKETH